MPRHASCIAVALLLTLDRSLALREERVAPILPVTRKSKFANREFETEPKAARRWWTARSEAWRSRGRRRRLDPNLETSESQRNEVPNKGAEPKLPRPHEQSPDGTPYTPRGSRDVRSNEKQQQQSYGPSSTTTSSQTSMADSEQRKHAISNNKSGEKTDGEEETRQQDSENRLNDKDKSAYCRAAALPNLDPKRPPVPASAAIAAPSLSTIASSLRSAVNRVLRHPNIGRLALTGVQVGLALYLVQGIWSAAADLIDEFQAEQDTSPAYLQRKVVSQILQELDGIQAASTGDASRNGNGPSVLEQQPVLAHLSKTLLASGMPLRASSDAVLSTEQVLLSLTRAEVHLLQQCLWTPPTSSAEDGTVHWSSVCGLQAVKESLLDLLWTWKHLDHGKNPYRHLVKRPPGVLLYGPPGCGKTLLVKAIASEAQVPCLVITPSLLFRKYVGDTNLQVRTLFQLAEKLSPCILCLDELDGLFRERSAIEHDVSRDLKTEFLQWWDGIASSAHSRILVVGATNRPFEVDSAVQRRMPQSHFIGLPHYEARLEVLAHLTKDIPLAHDFALEPLASKTEGFTPSDLHNVVRTAVTVGPMRESRISRFYRSLSTNDIMSALALTAPTQLTSSYSSALVEYAQRSEALPGTAMARQGSDMGQIYFDAGTVHVELEHSSENQGHSSRELTDSDSTDEDATYDEPDADNDDEDD